MTEQPTTLRSRKAMAAETEAALKDAALRVFAERGYLNAKITDITAEAGRAAGSFYNHFAGKEELLTSLLEDLLEAGDESVADPESAHNPDLSDPEAVRWHVAAFWQFQRDHLVVLTALRQAAQVNAEFGARVEQLMAADQDHLIGHLDWITKAGRSLPGDPAVVIAAMSGLLDGFAYRWQLTAGRLGGRPVPDDEVIDTLTTFIHRALNG